jgi:cupin fold WbuC family metalloprotein
MIIDKKLLDSLFEQAKRNPRLRINMDLRTTDKDGSQRMLNVMMPGTKVPIHRHPMSTENVILITGRMDEVLYEEEVTYDTQTSCDSKTMDAQDVARKVTLKEVARFHLCPAEGKYGCQVPIGVWHTVEVLEPSVIYEGKDGKYGEDGSEIFGQ